MLDTAVSQNQPISLINVMAESSGHFSKFKLSVPSLNSAAKLENTSSMLVLDLAQPGSLPVGPLGARNLLYGNFASDSQSG